MIPAADLRSRLAWICAGMDERDLSVLYTVAIQLAPEAARGLTPLPSEPRTPILLSSEEQAVSA